MDTTLYLELRVYFFLALARVIILVYNLLLAEALTHQIFHYIIFFNSRINIRVSTRLPLAIRIVGSRDTAVIIASRYISRQKLGKLIILKIYI